MKRAWIATAVLSLAFAVPAFAIDNSQPPNATGKTFEQRQTHILKMLDERLASLQEGKACVQAAKNDEDLKVCWQKHRAEMQQLRGEMKQHRGMGGQGGPMGPGSGQGGPMDQ